MNPTTRHPAEAPDAVEADPAAELRAQMRRQFLAAQILGRFSIDQAREALAIVGTPERQAETLTIHAATLAEQAGTA